MKNAQFSMSIDDVTNTTVASISASTTTKWNVTWGAQMIVLIHTAKCPSVKYTTYTHSWNVARPIKLAERN